MSFNQHCSNKVIKKARRGDKFALTQIYQLYKQPVFSMAFQMLRDEQRANDVLQTVMLKMMNSINTLSDSKKLNGWMKRVAYNTVIDVIRANSKLEDIGNEELFDYSVSQSLSVIKSDAWDLEHFLKILDERERLVVWLYAVEGFTHKDIAQKLELSEQNSRVIFSRAMKTLRQLAQEQNFHEAGS